MSKSTKQAAGYLHGFTDEERDRLVKQARFVEHRVHDRLPFQRSRNLLEVGCGVGAQSEILLRHFPDLHITGVDLSPSNLEHARSRLAGHGWADGRYDFQLADASSLDFEASCFDGAFLCWVLEHVAQPLPVLSEVRRVLRLGSPVVVTEVQNATFFVDPYSPHTLKFWMAFNDHQLELGGDPFVGAKLGNLLQAVGFRDITTEVRTIHLDNREPGQRAEFLAYWSELLASGAESMLRAGKVTEETVEGMKDELAAVGHDPNAVFFYSFVQARARVW
jgi:ubiquinone/menaquinone biosynthesis C-methylase UbiE